MSPDPNVGCIDEACEFSTNGSQCIGVRNHPDYISGTIVEQPDRVALNISDAVCRCIIQQTIVVRSSDDETI